ncbi:MAG TPA: hypothetical protein VFE33_08925 [Thermoanaerobaculia bacterium]|nr:hypothetical protein [Thermoanaerobaculia bacterium]
MTTLDATPKPFRLPFVAADWTAPGDLAGLQRKALIAGAIGTVASLLGLFLNPPVFFRAYLVAWLLVVGVSVGCLAISMLHHLSRGAWGLMVRRPLEAAARTIPLVGLLSIPIVLGIKQIFLWARPEVVAHDLMLQQKHWYLNVPFFIGRLIFYFVVWGGFGFVLDRLSRRQDEAPDPGLARRMQLLAAPGLAIYCLLATFASVDWLMSLQPHWFSTIYGIYFIGGQGLAALAFIILIALYLSRRAPMKQVLAPQHFHDYGKLFLAFVMLWAYFSFSQFLIIWAGNLPEEIIWYVRRIENGWGFLALSIVLFHFGMPFLLLLSRNLKRAPKRLGGLALFMLFMRWVDLYWQAEPAFHADNRFYFHWLFLTTLLAVGGIWLYAFCAELKKRPLLPINDPFLAEAVAHE